METTATNITAKLVRLICRMPVILRKDNYEEWLHGDPRKAETLLVPFPASEMQGYPVSKKVNVPAGDGAELIKPLAKMSPQSEAKQ